MAKKPTTYRIYHSKEEKIFWSMGGGKNLKILNALLDNKTLDEVCNEFNLHRPSVVERLRHPFFLKRLEDHLAVKLFDLERMKMQFKPQAFELLKNEFIKRLSQASPDTIVRETMKYLELLPQKKSLPPELLAILIKVIEEPNKEKLEEKREIELEKQFGYKPLKPYDQSEESTNSNPQLVASDRSENQQGQAN